MMRSFELSHYRRANVWLDEAPRAEFTATSLVTRLVKPKVVLDASRRTAGVELCVPYGARISYGLLGAELVQSDVDGLEVVVAVSKEGLPIQLPLAPKSDEVRVGMLEEYASAVIGGAVKVADAIGAPTMAMLRFRWAAFARVGSSSSVFEAASEIVLQLLMLPKGASDDQIRALLG